MGRREIVGRRVRKGNQVGKMNRRMVRTVSRSMTRVKGEGRSKLKNRNKFKSR